MKRQVLVNFAPRAIWALSGTVTSSIITALSVQAPEAEFVPAVPSDVPGVVFVDVSSVAVGGISVGTDKPGRVGGRVEVMKSLGVGVTMSGEIVKQELRLNVATRTTIQIFFIAGILLGKY